MLQKKVNKPPAGRSLNLHQLLGMVEMENSSALVVMTNLETENMIVISAKLVFLRPTLSTSYKNTIKCNLMTLFYDCESRLWNSSIKTCYFYHCKEKYCFSWKINQITSIEMSYHDGALDKQDSFVS